MAALPAASGFTGSEITEAQQKTWITDLRAYLSALLGDAGTVSSAQASLDVIFGAGVTAKSGAYTVATADRGQLFNCTGTWALTLPAAATAGAGFAFAARNSGSGAITIDPDGAELINGAGTFVLTAGAALIVVCTGAAWVVVGHPGTLDYVKHDNGHDSVGSLCFAISSPAQVRNPGSTLAGSGLTPAAVSGAAAGGGGTLSGTWRLLGYTSASTGSASVWQRIA